MKIIKVKNQEQAGKMILNLLKESLDKGAKTLGLATGSTPLAFYQELRASDLDFSEMTSINLDEYLGLSASHPQSYAYFMEEQLFKVKPFKQNFLPDGLASDVAAELAHYDQIIAQHPIDFQILGIGQNGHIGFNEPGTAFTETTHLVDLAASTIEANSRFFDHADQVPKQAISMGLASIMSAKEIVLMAFGQQKADAIAQMIQGPVTEDLPASILQNHAQVTVIVDEAAGAKLT